jgi:hypothetical protein
MGTGSVGGFFEYGYEPSNFKWGRETLDKLSNYQLPSKHSLCENIASHIDGYEKDYLVGRDVVYSGRRFQTFRM